MATISIQPGGHVQHPGSRPAVDDPARQAGGTLCSNGLSAALTADDTLRFTDFATMRKDAEGHYHFSNGIKVWRSAAGGIRFSTGISVRRRSYNTFDISNGLVCQLSTPEIAACERR